MMHPHASGRGGAWASNDDMMLFSLIIIVVGSCVFGYFTWIYYHGEISAAVIGWRRWEIAKLAHFTDAFAAADRQMATANPYQVSIGALYRISHAIGAAWRLPACILIGLLAILCARRNAPGRYRRRFYLMKLAVEQGRHFLSTAPFLDQKLRLVSPSARDVRPADYALTAEEWIDLHARDGDGSFSEPHAAAALKVQLGSRWKGAQALSPAELVLYVAFSRHLTEQRDEAVRLLGDVGDTLTGLDAEDDGRGPPAPLAVSQQIATECRQLLRDHAAFTQANAITQRHAWTTPALMSLLTTARTRSGVLPPALFGWLKLVDRPLWYALQSLGFEAEGIGRYLHPNPRVEAVGARDHWAVERAAGIPVVEPSLDRAMIVLQRHARSSTKSAPVRNRAAHPTAA